jgi:hypothetical protein
VLAAEAGNRFEATIRRRQIDIEGVVRLFNDLEDRGCHGTEYGIGQHELHLHMSGIARQLGWLVGDGKDGRSLRVGKMT